MATRHCDCPAPLIRAWARSAGHSVADRGQLPWQIHDLYHEAFPRLPDAGENGAAGCEVPGNGAALVTPSTAPGAGTSDGRTAPVATPCRHLAAADDLPRSANTLPMSSRTES